MLFFNLCVMKSALSQQPVKSSAERLDRVAVLKRRNVVMRIDPLVLAVLVQPRLSPIANSFQSKHPRRSDEQAPVALRLTCLLQNHLF